MQNPHVFRGVTLLEHIVALAIFAILITAAIPSFRSLVAEAQVQATTDTLARAAFLARTESIKRGQRVITCLSDTDTACNSASATRILIFTDSDRSGVPTSPADIIQDLTLKEPEITVTYNRPFLAYTATGYAAGTNGTFKVCHLSGVGNMIIVSALGRPREAIDYNGDGIVEKTPGQPVSC